MINNLTLERLGEPSQLYFSISVSTLLNAVFELALNNLALMKGQVLEIVNLSWVRREVLQHILRMSCC